MGLGRKPFRQQEFMQQQFKSFQIRPWTPRDRAPAADLICDVLTEYGLPWQPESADQDVIEVEAAYLKYGGQFWVVEQNQKVVGTAAFRPTHHGNNAVEIRKMYLDREVRGQGLGKRLLQSLEQEIIAQGFTEVWLETASPLQEAIQMYEKAGYLPATGVETARCDRIYKKLLSTL